MSESPSQMQVYPLRIAPGEEVLSFLKKFVRENNLKAAFIVTCVGSVRRVSLRFATDLFGKEGTSEKEENLEICSLVGTISQEGCHIHGTFGNVQGSTLSGHVTGNMIVQTTVEIVIGNATGHAFTRVYDAATGFRELVVKPIKGDEQSGH